MRAGQLRPAYIYRDPRDAMLSAYENGQRAIAKGHPNAFSHLVDFDTSVHFMLDYVRIWEAWMKCRETTLHTRYEDLLSSYDTEAARLVSFLRLDLDSIAVRGVIEHYRPEGSQHDQKGLHFNKGKAGRFRQKMTPEQIDILAQVFGPYLEKMGYPI